MKNARTCEVITSDKVNISQSRLAVHLVCGIACHEYKVSDGSDWGLLTHHGTQSNWPPLRGAFPFLAPLKIYEVLC